MLSEYQIHMYKTKKVFSEPIDFELLCLERIKSNFSGPINFELTPVKALAS